MRISGVRLPVGYLRWAALGIGLFLLAILVTVLANTLILAGLTASEEDSGTPVTATVSVGAPCDAPGANERVTFTVEGPEREARFDGCGHAEGERVEITLPPGETGGDLVVHAAQAAVGDSAPGAGLGSLLLLTTSAGGAGYVYLLRRGPRGTPLPRALRPV